MTENESIPKIVGVRFSKVGKVYNFDASKVENIQKGDVVVVETSRGWQLGEVIVLSNAAPQDAKTNGWKSIDRLATPKDLMQRQSWQNQEHDVVEKCKERAAELHLSHFKVVASEYSFDGSRLTILFSSDVEEKVELKSLRSDMQKLFAPAQVELRQIGPRDVAKIMGGLGACGLECRCCTRFITEFSSISIKMAKEQGISLTPTEITGMCGRLRCCLIYEYENYVDARKVLPKKNRRVLTPDGEGKVVDVQPLNGIIIVDLPERGKREYPKEDIKLLDEPENAPKIANLPVAGKQGGGGGCGQCRWRQ
jgi:cell fate regulator YaaT (PSP1 superfamily)